MQEESERPPQPQTPERQRDELVNRLSEQYRQLGDNCGSKQFTEANGTENGFGMIVGSLEVDGKKVYMESAGFQNPDAKMILEAERIAGREHKGFFSAGNGGITMIDRNGLLIHVWTDTTLLAGNRVPVERRDQVSQQSLIETLNEQGYLDAPKIVPQVGRTGMERLKSVRQPTDGDRFIIDPSYREGAMVNLSSVLTNYDSIHR